MTDIDDESVDLILSDLPYEMTNSVWDKRVPMDELWKQYRRTIKDKGTIVLFGLGLFSVDLINAGRKYYRYSMVWEKTRIAGFLNANIMPLRIHEDILIFGKAAGTYNPQMTGGKPYTNNRKPGNPSIYDTGMRRIPSTNKGDRHPLSIIKFNNTIVPLHPTQKPLELIAYLMRTYSNEGDLVLDNCSGSGTVGVVANDLNRNFILIEKDERYYKISVDRVMNNNTVTKLRGKEEIQVQHNLELWGGQGRGDNA